MTSITVDAVSDIWNIPDLAVPLLLDRTSQWLRGFDAGLKWPLANTAEEEQQFFWRASTLWKATLFWRANTSRTVTVEGQYFFRRPILPGALALDEGAPWAGGVNGCRAGRVAHRGTAAVRLACAPGGPFDKGRQQVHRHHEKPDGFQQLEASVGNDGVVLLAPDQRMPAGDGRLDHEGACV